VDRLRISFGIAARRVGCALVGLLVPVTFVAAEEPAGAFALISDFHLDPFGPPELAGRFAVEPPDNWMAIFESIETQKMSLWGSDTNYALFASSLVAFAKSADAADFAIVPGDLIAHEFERKAAEALDVTPSDAKVRDLAIKTTLFVGNSLGRALPDKPIILALGNNDSDCGDYEITPGGRYLSKTREMVRRLAGADLVAKDFDETYGAGGYYAVRHPGLPQTLILVVNDVLWSAKYQDACGTGGEAAAEAMMTWLGDNLARQRAAGDSVWLVHHIPWGIDPYSTAHSRGTDCAAKVVPFLREPYAAGFIGLLREYKDIIQASYSGHVHTDDYRLLVDDRENVLGLQKIPPAISPIYGQNPGYEIVSYDLKSGVPTDFSTYYLANLDGASLAVPGDWRFEYTFTEAYGIPSYSAEGVAEMVKAIEAGGADAETYRGLYTVGHDPLPEKDLPAYVCAMTRLDQDGFTKCYCGG
jgi:sphingomyelin phosphodiesterase acid-like 3